MSMNCPSIWYMYAFEGRKYFYYSTKTTTAVSLAVTVSVKQKGLVHKVLFYVFEQEPLFVFSAVIFLETSALHKATNLLRNTFRCFTIITFTNKNVLFENP